MLNHDEKDYKLWLNSKGGLHREEQQYGVWMRATMERFYKSQPVTYHKGNSECYNGYYTTEDYAIASDYRSG